ncbi:hypothetical protein HDV01_004262 [Terramyces sp. JEL0728]|nr:hypothetical protein HDV01_004262 [Terramyces sp. JEL0728]
MLNLIQCLNMFYCNYYRFSVTLNKIVDALAVTMLLGILVTGLRILKIYKYINPNISDHWTRVANTATLILYVIVIVPCLANVAMTPYLPQPYKMIKAYIMMVWTVIVVVYDNVQSIYLLNLAYGRNQFNAKERVILEFRKATAVILFIMAIDWIGVVFEGILIMESDGFKQMVYAQIAVGLSGIHYCGMQMMMKQLCVLTFSGLTPPKVQESTFKATELSL